MKTLAFNKTIWKVTELGVMATSMLPSGVLAAATDKPANCADTSAGSNFTIQNGVNCGAAQNSQVGTLFGNGGVFQLIANILIFIIGAVAVIMLIFGGFRYVVSAGNKDQVSGAKNTILYAVVGIVVAILAYAIVNFVISSLAPSGNTP